MSIWDDIPSDLRDNGQLDPVRPLLDGLNGSGPVETTDEDGTWSVYTATEDLSRPLALDPRTGAFSGSSGTSGTPIEFRDPSVSVALGLHLTGPGGTRDGGWRVILGAPSVAIRVPYLRGALVDAQGQLRADASQPTVAFVLPALRIRVQQLSGGSVGVKLLSANIGGGPTDNIFELISMQPPHALVGPGDVVGFAFRSAVLDFSGTAGPGVPATARVLPAEWQGLYLPEVRLFVAPNGLEGIAVSAGVRDLWIGIGAHDGLTGVFDAEVVNRGKQPTIHASFRTTAGELIAVSQGDTVELPEQSTVFVDAAGGLAPVTVRIDVGGNQTNDERAAVTTPAAGSVSIVITASDSGSHTASRTITATRRAAATSAGNAEGLVTVRPTRRGSHAIVQEAASPTKVTVRLEPRASAAWSWPGGAANGETAEVPVASGATVVVTAVLPAAEPEVADCFFLFNCPPALPTGEQEAYYRNEKKVRAGPAAGPDQPGSAASFRSEMEARRVAIGVATQLTVDGYASYENDDSTETRAWNLDLSKRRLAAAMLVLNDLGFTNVVEGVAHGHVPARDQTPVVAGGPTPSPGNGGWWRARAYSPVAATAETCVAEIVRAAPPATEATDPLPPAPARPDCFRRIGVRVEFIRSTFIRGEIFGEFDIETATEAALRRNGQPALRNAPRNPSDGICTFLLRLRLTEDRGAWDVTAEFRALEADLDGLAKMDAADANTTALNVLGALSVMAPLSASASDLSPAAGAIVALGSVALGASDTIDTKSLILRGGELRVTDGIAGPDGATTVSESGTQVSVLLDLEVAFSFDLGIVRVDPAHPVTTRYKAVGVRSRWGEAAGAGGAPEYLPLPVFDPSRGYTLDVPTGALSASPPLDELLRILGFRVSRDNPTFLEIEVGLGVDLGIVTVDAVRVRARLDGPPLDLQLTKLAASLEIPGTIHGAGSIEFTPQGFRGAFDLTIVPVNIRASAVLAVERDIATGTTGVLIGAEVEFPVPILLGNSGLGIYGFLGGIGVNYARNETPFTSLVPALDWLQAQLGRAGGVMAPDGWTLTPGAFAVAAGMLVGTVDGGFTVHLKGIVIVEVPGPRLLLAMKADVLSLPPVLNSNQSATFLAVLDIDFGQGTITIGIVAAYEIEQILRVRVPVTAFFNARQPEEWLVDLGSYSDRVTVEVLDVISGSGYLMVHGDGITLPTDPVLSAPNGIAVATGFHLQAVLMGSKSVGLYLEVAAGFDALLGLDPAFLGGIIYVRGELRLFIIGIAASAELTVQVGTRVENGVVHSEPFVHGEVCGSVDFFFFSVRGCVGLTIGAPITPTPVPRPLVAGVALVSRSPALLEGTGAGRSIEGKLADAVEDGAGGALPTVPLDAIPAITFNVAPTGGGDIFLGHAALGTSGAPANPWVRIGDRWWRYELVGVDLAGPLIPAPPTGNTPCNWWKPAATGGPSAGPTLALLSWLPTPQSVAVPYGEALTRQVDRRWGTVCREAAPAARLLWTFDRSPTGPSPTGWDLAGLPWPDPPGTARSTPVAGRLAVREPWRIDPVTDRVQSVSPAVVVGDAVPCYDGRPGEPVDPMKTWRAGQPLTFSNQAPPEAAAIFAGMTERLAAGGRLRDQFLALQESSWDPEIGDPAARVGFGCQGRILRAPGIDWPKPALFGTASDRERVEKVWSDAGFVPDPLAGAVTLEPPQDGFTALTLLLLVPERGFGERLRVSVRDAKGGELAALSVLTAHMVGTSNPLPAAWMDPAGPWADPVQRAGRIAARTAAGAQDQLFLVLVPLKTLPRGTARVAIGWERGDAESDLELPVFYVVAAEGALESEAARVDWDTTDIDADREALTAALSQPADNVALLTPDKEYTVTVTWKAAFVEGDAQPPAGQAPAWLPQSTQKFQFRANPPAEAPTDLSPWLLATTPGMDDTGVFCREPVRIAFATQKVAALFDAHGKELRIVVRAASGHHPEPPGGGPIDLGVVIAVTPTAPFGTLSQSFGVTTPWQQAVRETLVARGQRCVPTSGSSTETYTLTLDYDFEPLTDYLIDIHAVPKRSPAGTTGLVHRIGFTTSRFADAGDLAGLIAPASILHRVIPTPAALASLPDAPTGAVLDDALQAAGLGAAPLPDFPRIQVLWTMDAIPQPFAVLVDSSEPLWRSRSVPTVVKAPADGPDPTHVYWAARPADWLRLVASTVPPAAGDQPRAGITRIVRGPGGTRAIALLAAGGRGCEARLDLVTLADPLAGLPDRAVTAVRVSLARAPWEVED